MLRHWEFQLPTRIQFGRGGLRKLGETAKRLGNSALLVGYRDRAALAETYARAARALSEAAVAVTEFFEVQADPDAESAVEGARRAADAGVDLIIGLGGGSAIDVAKGIATLVRMGGRPWDYGPFGKKCNSGLLE